MGIPRTYMTTWAHGGRADQTVASAPPTSITGSEGGIIFITGPVEDGMST